MGPKMTQTRSKQPKMVPNHKHPKNGQKWCRNSFEKIDFWSFWGHFGSFSVFWVIFSPKNDQTLLAKYMTPNHPHGPKNGSKIAFFSHFVENTHFSEFGHHGFQSRLKTSIFDENRSILAQIKAKTMLLHVVQSASLSRFYRKHYLPSNLLENRKSWNPSVYSATVIFGAKMAVKNENLNVYKLADPQNPLSALPIWCF